MQRLANQHLDPDGTRHPSIPSDRADVDTDSRRRASSSPHGSLLRRLNGRPQACDPCRMRKVACDHTQPVCSRCLKRNQASQCVYTVSDQTSVASSAPSREPRRAGSSSSPVRKPGRLKTSSRASPKSARRQVKLPRGYNPTATPTGDDEFRRAARLETSAIASGATPPRSEGYLGYTSYSNVFDEARNTLSFLNNGNSEATPSASNGNSNVGSANPSPNTANSARHSQPPLDRYSDPLPAQIRTMSLEVLRCLPNPSYEKLKRPQAWSPTQYWGRYASDRILATLQRRYGSALGPNRDDVQLELMARDFSANSREPFNNDIEDPEAFLDQFAGDDLRWESIGLLFCFREYAPDVNGSGAAPPPRSRVWDKKISLQLWSEPARRCLHLCLDLARNFTEGNSILMFLYIRHMVINSLVYGDASFELWLSHAAAVAMVTFLGLHAIPDTPDYKPCLASELKRRLFSNIFTLDKVGSSFHGRPPLLSHRWTTTPPPLDIRDEALLAGGRELQAAIASLDAEGWATSGEMESVTLARGRVAIAVIKEELMDIAFGKSKHVPIAAINDIHRRELRIFETFPPWCKYRDGDIDDLDLSIEVIFCRLLLKLEHLQACLLAARLIARHGGPDDGSLLYVSFELVRHVLVLWQHADRFEGGSGGARVDFLWMVMSYGAPGGGVLCMELLFPTLPNRPVPYESPTTPRVTRSAIIQNLSLLVGFLAWVGPEAPNSGMTTNCKRLIQSVLDYTLNQVQPVPGAQSVANSGGGEGSGGAAGFLEGLETGQLDFGIDFLGTFDWFRSDEPLPEFGFRP